MKLELKHLASYLPYKLYILIKDDIFIEYNEFLEEEQYVEKGIYKLNGITKGTSYLEEGIFLSSTDKNIGDSFVEKKYIKPILFPLSKYYSEENGYGGYIAFKDFEYEVINKRISLKVYEDLLENKFDVFGLIEAGLAEPVTEEFNPYK